MTTTKFYIGERKYEDGKFFTNVIRDCKDWDDAQRACEEFAKQWQAEGLDADTWDDENDTHVGVRAIDPETFETKYDYLVCYEYIPQVGAIDPTIKGYEFVKNVVYCGGSERTGDNMLFVFKRNVASDDLRALCEVAERTRESLADLKARYPEDEYVIHWGCIRTLPKGAMVLPSGGDIIDLYLS